MPHDPATKVVSNRVDVSAAADHDRRTTPATLRELESNARVRFDQAMESLRHEQWREAALEFESLAAPGLSASSRMELLLLGASAAGAGGHDDLALRMLRRPELGDHPQAARTLLRLHLRRSQYSEATRLLEELEDRLPEPAISALLRAAATTIDHPAASGFIVRALSDSDTFHDSEFVDRFDAACRGPDRKRRPLRFARILTGFCRELQDGELAFRGSRRILELARAEDLIAGLAARLDPETLSHRFLKQLARAAHEVDLLPSDFIDASDPALSQQLCGAALAVHHTAGDEMRWAESVLDSILVDEPHELTALTLRAELYDRTKQWEPALETYAEAAKLTQDATERSDLYLRIGTILEEHYDAPNKALENYMVAFIASNANRNAFQALDRLYRDLKRYRDLSGVYQISIEEARRTGAGPFALDEQLLELARIEMQCLRRPRHAADALLELISLDPAEDHYLGLLRDVVAPRLSPAERARVLDRAAAERRGDEPSPEPTK